MAIVIPDFSLYTDNQMIADFSTQFQLYLDAYNKLTTLGDNPADDAEADFIANIPTELTIEEAQSYTLNSTSIATTVAIDQTAYMDQRDYAYAFAEEFFNRFPPFVRMEFPVQGQAMEWDGVAINVVPI